MICFVIVLSFLLKNASASIDHLDAEVEHKCIQRCPLQNRTDVGPYDLRCNNECNIDQCTKGCKLWKSALRSSCKSVCNGTLERLPQKQLYCVMGCNDATTSYFAELRLQLGTPPAPALVADSLTATSLKLEWHFPEAKKAGLRYLIQWKYEEIAATWQFCRNQTWGRQDTVFVENLQPYTKYRFRVAILLSHHGELIVSAPSVVISTLPSGIPASPPAIVRAVPIDSSRVSVSWEPGPFPHGPLLSYVLRIIENQPQGYTALKDIPAEKNYYIVQNLQPGKNYTVSVSMRNGIGAGPAANVSVSTPQPQKLKNTEQPILILAAHHVVTEQGPDLFEDPVILYETQFNIRGIAMHISHKLLFISESSGNIHRIRLKDRSKNATLFLTTSQIGCTPLELSMDWLNEQLYILCETQLQQHRVWRIIRTDLDGKALTVIIAGLTSKPHYIEVDPCNGYLFWSSNINNKVGLYRLDLSNINNGIKHDVKPQLILEEANLGAFTVDYSHYRLLISYQSQNTINAVSFDGKEILNLRPNINKSALQKVLSLATANDRFYWVDGTDVFYEEHHPSSNSYFHNTYPILSGLSYEKALVNLPSAQPLPVPVYPPLSVQVIFGTYVAKATWQRPHLLGVQGKGAWQNWSYEIEISDVRKNITVSVKNINTTYYTINKLQPNTEYIFRVAAERGPWSKEFRGISLRVTENNKYPLILWSAAEGLLKSDVTGENVESVIHKSMMKNFYFINLAWYEDQLYLVTNTSQIYWYNTTSHGYGQLTDIESAGSIAVDWIGKKLYWSNPKQQLIIRGNLNGTQQEPLTILTLAKELNIDAVQAYIYWSTGYAVECAHLNGVDRVEYHPAELFSGKQVMGLTLDMDHHFVFWIVRDSEGSNLFKAPMAGYHSTKVTADVISNLQKSNMQGPLCYFDNRLLWLQDPKNAAISDMEGKNIAKISGKSMSSLTMVYVIDPSLHVWPKGKQNKLSVIPHAVDKYSIKTKGPWKSFDITWKPVSNVNFGTVFYEININNTMEITSKPSVRYNQSTTPFEKLHIAISAFTYWGTSPQIQVEIYSPPSTPSAPINLRTYISHTQKDEMFEVINATFRWNPPEQSNGVIRGYKIFCWYYEEQDLIDVCKNKTVSPTSVQYDIVGNLTAPQTYYFQVQAYTDVGDGQISEVHTMNTAYTSALPILLISSNDSIYLKDIDINQNYPIFHGLSMPVQISYLHKEQKFFWINEMHEVLMLNNPSNPIKYTKIFDTNGKALSLTVDWVERSLYYVEIYDNIPGSSIMKLDLNHFEKGKFQSVAILTTEAIIYQVNVSPYTRKIYWTELSSHGQYRLMQCDTSGENVEPFFKDYMSDGNKSCSCPLIDTIGKSFALDHSKLKDSPEIVFLDLKNHTLISTDKNGCLCSIIANIGNSSVDGLQADYGSVYWISHQILHVLIRGNTEFERMESFNINNMLIYGQHTQPFPPDRCLMPLDKSNITVSLQEKSADSITLIMPELSSPPGCDNISMSSIEYKIYYKKYEDNEPLTCDITYLEASTFNTVLKVGSLEPFQNYVVCLCVSNYYMQMKEKDILIGPGVLFQTATGTPSEPRNISARVLNPTLVEINWLPPESLNGKTVRYEVHWQMEVTKAGIRQKGEQTVPEQSSEWLRAYLQKLLPNETYSVWVRVYGETNDTSSDSLKVQITTFPEPSNLELVNATAYSLVVKWEVFPYIKEYTLQYSLLMLNEWITFDDITNDTDTLIINIENLQPKMQYKFRFLLIYPEFDKDYIWPSDTYFIFETEGDRPSPPGVPNIQHVKADVYQVLWEASKDNGAPIQLYMLESLKLLNYRNKRSTNRTAWLHNSPYIEQIEYDWESVYNGTDTSWIISGLDDKYKYAFRVSAYNSYGWSNPSEESVEFDVSEAAQLAAKQDPTNLVIIAICVPVVVCFFLIICCVCCKWRCGRNEKIKQITVFSQRPDVELATLRELPRRGNFIHNTNVLYVSTQPTADELTDLPHIRRDQITLMKFLGSGAFGEVYEGNARGLTSGEIKVAVKTLRKGASDQEKNDFLKEAQLMSQFKHEHILQMLGVCLDNDPHLIVMELMQGGDLLTYLRSSRNPNSNTPSLSLPELLKMCVDVAKGCRYLEETHFVHRDLACRNCLVSSTDPLERIVKIGDFGLARDIYKNDYYRKEGEGLLPVRWMALESLIDGVFTCQSDVWAFGILLWEIMTLGQQPYPAISNVEILSYLRQGERLGKPMDCPEELHVLMLKCWDAEPERRPTFKYCLEVLENLNHQISRNVVTGAHEGQYISTVPEGTSWKSGADADSTQLLQQAQEIPKYLELLYDDSDCLPENDGYEIPRSSMRQKSADCNGIGDTLPNHSNRARTEMNSTTCSSFKNILSELTDIENLLRDENRSKPHVPVPSHSNVNKQV